MLIVESVEETARAEMVAAASIAAAGGEITIPLVHERREEFDLALVAEETRATSEQQDILSALGIGDR